MKILMVLSFAFWSHSCCSFKKCNAPMNPGTNNSLDSTIAIYEEGVNSELDSSGLVTPDGSIGDSALFTCLAYSAGAIKFDPAVLFTDEGKPLRHPDIAPPHATPISRDMTRGILFCLYTLGKTDKDKALKLITKMIDYGRNNKMFTTWSFCSPEDVENYQISSKHLGGRCLMTPAIIKDIYRVAVSLGYECDQKCKNSMALGFNIPANNTGFERHLAVIATLLNGLVENGINGNSLSMLKKAAEENPNNALYQAVYHLFSDGNMNSAISALRVERYFPVGSFPTAENYSTDYLYQRDEIRVEDFTSDSEGCIQFINPSEEEVIECELEPNTKYKRTVFNHDYLPGDEDKLGKGVEWLFAAKIVKGEL